jgi:hypothetical protein
LKVAKPAAWRIRLMHPGHQYALVAQWIEYLASNQGVASSNLAGRTN